MITNNIITSLQSAITTCDIVRKNSDAYRYVISLLHNQIFDLVEWGCNKPDFFKIAKNYTGSSIVTLDRFENVTKLLTLAPITQFFDGTYDQSSYLYQAGRAALLLSDIKTGIEFASSYSGFSRLTALSKVATHASVISNGLFALDAFFKWYAPADVATPVQIESVKWKAVSYTADFALGALVAAGVQSVPLLGAVSVACVGFKVYSVVFDHAHQKEIKQQSLRKTPLDSFVGKFCDYVRISETNYEAKEKIVKLVHKVTALTAAYYGSISATWTDWAAQAQQTDKLNETFAVFGPAMSICVPKDDKYLLSSGVSAEVIGTVAYFALKALSALCFGESLGFYKLNFSHYKIGRLPVVGLTMGLLGTAMSAAIVFGARKSKQEKTSEKPKLPFYTKMAKSATMSLSFASTLAGIDSASVRAGLTALGAVVDAMGYVSALQSSPKSA